MHVLWCAVPCVCLSSVCLSLAECRPSPIVFLLSVVCRPQCCGRQPVIVIGHWPLANHHHNTTTSANHQHNQRQQQQREQRKLGPKIRWTAWRGCVVVLNERTNERTNEQTNERTIFGRVSLTQLTHSQTTNHKPPPSLTHSLTHSLTSLHFIHFFLHFSPLRSFV